MSHTIPNIAPVPNEGDLMVAWKVRDRRCLVVGGDDLAAARARALLGAGARVAVAGARPNAELRARAARGELELIRRALAETDLDGTAMVLVADDSEGPRVAALCRAHTVPVNVADMPELCDFAFCAMVEDGPVKIAVSTGGLGPAVAQRVRDLVAQALPEELPEATRRFARLRSAIRAAGGDRVRRMAWLGEIGRTWAWARLAALDEDEIAELASEYAGDHRVGLISGEK